MVSVAKLDGQFKVDYLNAMSDVKAVFKGNKYRITILSERLIRFEYDANGKFFDHPTEFARFRNFSVPDFQVEENDKTLVIQTKYFVLQYIKERPFEGPKYAPDQNLKVGLMNSDTIPKHPFPEIFHINFHNTPIIQQDHQRRRSTP